MTPVRWRALIETDADENFLSIPRYKSKIVNSFTHEYTNALPRWHSDIDKFPFPRAAPSEDRQPSKDKIIIRLPRLKSTPGPASETKLGNGPALARPCEHPRRMATALRISPFHPKLPRSSKYVVRHFSCSASPWPVQPIYFQDCFVSDS